MIGPLRVGASSLTLLPVIRGLESEGERVREIILSGHFDLVALSISPEELDTLSSDPDVRGEASGTEEEVYIRELGRFGPVRKPPPCFVEAVRAARSMGVDCSPLDMKEEEYTELYIKEISGLELVRHSLHLRRLPKMSFESETPEALVLELDTLFNRLKGFKRVEEAREAHISSSILALCAKAKQLLALVELERSAGVIRRVEEIATPPDSGVKGDSGH